MQRVVRGFLKRIDPLIVGVFALGFVGPVLLELPLLASAAVAIVFAVSTCLLKDKAKKLIPLIGTNKPLEIAPPQRQFKVPNQVKDLLAEINEKSQQIEDQQFRLVLYQMCLDIEKYFQSNSKDKARDTLVFKERLTEVFDVLVKYIEVQGNMRYYDNSEALLQRGKESISDFSQYVLTSIRRGHAATLIDYTVNTNILEAQRYR